LRKSPPTIPEESRYPSPYKFNLDGSQPILTNDGGSAKMARQSFWPILRRQALYALSLSGVGMREPHWHPTTAELGYIREGKGRMSILDPNGTVDTYEIQKGDLYFIPKAYPHHIENLEKTPLNIMIFFDQGMPGDIGMTGSIRSFSNEVLGAATNMDPPFFDQLTKYYKDLFIVNKLNAIE
jgi:oxalate decarboxylase